MLIVAIKKTRDSISRKTTKNKQHAFLFQLPSFPWAKRCLLLNNDSIHDHTASIPLSPLVALGSFFIAQKTSIQQHDHRHDPTIQLLYSISQHAFEHVVTHENKTVDDLLGICEHTESKYKDVIQALENLPSSNIKKRVMDSMNDGLDTIRSYKRIYMPSRSPSPSPPSSQTLPESSQSLPESSSSANWRFVDSYKEGLGTDKMNWKSCYLEGRRQGHFTNFTKHTSLKNAYQRWKKQHYNGTSDEWIKNVDKCLSIQ